MHFWRWLQGYTCYVTILLTNPNTSFFFPEYQQLDNQNLTHVICLRKGTAVGNCVGIDYSLSFLSSAALISYVHGRENLPANS